jgi:hypothetical protein
MPVLEAMACGCPVVTCANSSLTEVGGAAAVYVDPDDAGAMAAAVIALADPAARAARAQAGIAQAARFTIAAQAATTMAAFRATIAGIEAGTLPRPGDGWREFRSYQAGVQEWLQDAPRPAARAGGAAPPKPSGELARALAEIEAMRNSPFWRLRGLVIGALRRAGLRHRG